MNGIITDIQRFSVHDGNGIRTVVFLKGCPLRCAWCQNPETQAVAPQLLEYKQNCIGCAACTNVCPLIHMEQGRPVTDRAACIACGKCTKVCPAGVRQIAGKTNSVEEIARIVLADRPFYKHSGGGMTLSGGEPTMQPDFAEAILRQVKLAGVHTAMETCGFCREETFLRLLEWVDLLLFDVKHMDPETHRRYTGVDNRLILRNLQAARQCGKSVIIRIPLIPGLNDTEENLRATAALASKLSIQTVHLLPFHQMGQTKWTALDADYQFAQRKPMERSAAETAAAYLRGFGLDVNVGGYGTLETKGREA